MALSDYDRCILVVDRAGLEAGAAGRRPAPQSCRLNSPAAVNNLRCSMNKKTSKTRETNAAAFYNQNLIRSFE
jgi:hypothetical protein